MKREIGIFEPADPEMLAWAINAPLMQYSREFLENENGIVPSSSAALYLAVTQFSEPERAGVRERLIAQLQNLTVGGNEPGFNAGPFWHYATVSMCIALCRYMPEVWGAFSDDERGRLTLIMECFAISSAFVTNDPNEYRTGASLTGNYYKLWNPNHRMAMTLPIVASAVFFSADGADGAERVNELLLGFDHAAYIDAFDRSGFSRAKHYWTTEGITLPDGRVAPGIAELMMQGGDAFLCDLDRYAVSNKLKVGMAAGTGVGVHAKYTYFGMGLNDLAGIVSNMYDYNYAGGKVISDTADIPNGTDENGKPLAYIADGSRSPVEGMLGMMKEFISGDAGGIRSSTSYCMHDFILVMQSYAVLYGLGVMRLTADDPLFRLMWVGNEDLVYKNERGYNSYSIGRSRGISDETSHPEYLPWKALWRANFSAMLKP